MSERAMRGGISLPQGAEMARNVLFTGLRHPRCRFRPGGLAEIIEHGRTGFLVRYEAEIAGAIKPCRGIEPEICRQTAHEKFGAAA